MSTRANIVIKEGDEKLFFYRHSDGYPGGTMLTLSIFMSWLMSGKIRNNIGQGSGWLILLGAMEYNSIPDYTVKDNYASTSTIKAPKDWKVGAYEPTTVIHGDIEYLYVIDMDTKTLQCFDSWNEETGEGITKVDLTAVS